MTALHTGFWWSGLLSLTWEDADFRHPVVTVRAAYGKNGKSCSVSINKILTTTLQAVRMRISFDSPVFRSHQGTPYRSFRTACERAVRQAVLGDFTFHALRHLFVSRLVMAGVGLHTVQDLMGHKDISMTLRYTHLSSDHKQRTVRALE